LVKFKVKANPQGQYYFPKEVREELGKKLELICNARAGVIFPEGTPLETVLESLEVIQRDLHHRRELQEKESCR
jgi:bifunctional DNA-binding transcriptional regulator/antitoxin component of YhaV-PrlF toxin-antitoxin module